MKLRTEFTLALTKREFYWLITVIVLALWRVLKWLLEQRIGIRRGANWPEPPPIAVKAFLATAAVCLDSGGVPARFAFRFRLWRNQSRKALSSHIERVTQTTQ